MSNDELDHHIKNFLFHRVSYIPPLKQNFLNVIWRNNSE